MKLINLIFILLQTFISFSQIEPQWLFPIWFTDAEGSTDTIYIGYDPSAGLGGEFEEDFEDYTVIDTSAFNAVVYYGQPSPYSGNYNIDSGKSIEIMGGSIDAPIDFIHGQMPITMYWDMSLLHSNALPYPDISPYPNAVGSIYCGAGEPGYVNCPSAFDGEPLIMTDSINPYYMFPVTSPHVFEGSGIPPFDEPEEVLYSFYIEFAAFHLYNAINVFNTNETLQVFPNPFTDKITISNLEIIKKIDISNVMGEVLYSCMPHVKKIDLDTSTYPAGLFIVTIESGENRSSQYLVKK